jgi:hypothetical protein
VAARPLVPVAPPLTRAGRCARRGEEDPAAAVWCVRFEEEIEQVRVSPSTNQYIYVSEIAGLHQIRRSRDQWPRLAGRRTGPEVAHAGLGAGPIRRPSHLLSGLKPMRA